MKKKGEIQQKAEGCSSWHHSGGSGGDSGNAPYNKLPVQAAHR